MSASLYRDSLPQLEAEVFLTDGGLETTLIFHDGIDLPDFAAFPLLERDDGIAALRRYFERYISIAVEQGLGLVLETPTWRASKDWGTGLGYSPERLAALNRAAVELLVELRDQHATPSTPIVVSGNIGPRGDGYVPGELMSGAEAEEYHGAQVRTFADSAADLVTAVTINYPAEAVGIVRAAAVAGVPCVISFTVETDGRLPTGESLAEAIEHVDDVTGGGPVYYMINCAHPTHFEHTLSRSSRSLDRIWGLRANASAMSHEELDAAEELDDGDPEELAMQYRQLRGSIAHLVVLGGCCGTDHRHIEAIARACAAS